jgi:hypothetical protein
MILEKRRGRNIRDNVVFMMEYVSKELSLILDAIDRIMCARSNESGDAFQFVSSKLRELSQILLSSV